MKRLVPAILLVLVLGLAPWQTRTEAAGLTYGSVLTAIKGTDALVGALPATLSSVSLIDVSQVVSSGDPFTRRDTDVAADPYRTSYNLAIYSHATAILSLRSALSSIQTGTGVATGDGFLTEPVSQFLAEQNVAANTVVAATLGQSTLTVFYDSAPTARVLDPSAPYVPPNPIVPPNPV